MKDLTQGSVTRHLLNMAAFMAVSMFVQTLYLLADLYWVSHLGKEAIAAVSVAGTLNMIILALTQTLGVGATTLISQAQAGNMLTDITPTDEDQEIAKRLCSPHRKGDGEGDRGDDHGGDQDR